MSQTTPDLTPSTAPDTPLIPPGSVDLAGMTELVGVVVGTNEVNWRIHKDLFTESSKLARDLLETGVAKEELTIRLPDQDSTAFSCYVAHLYAKVKPSPTFDVVSSLKLYKLGQRLQSETFCRVVQEGFGHPGHLTVPQLQTFLEGTPCGDPFHDVFVAEIADRLLVNKLPLEDTQFIAQFMENMQDHAVEILRAISKIVVHNESIVKEEVVIEPAPNNSNTGLGTCFTQPNNTSALSDLPVADHVVRSPSNVTNNVFGDFGGGNQQSTKSKTGALFAGFRTSNAAHGASFGSSNPGVCQNAQIVNPYGVPSVDQTKVTTSGAVGFAQPRLTPAPVVSSDLTNSQTAAVLSSNELFPGLKNCVLGRASSAQPTGMNGGLFGSAPSGHATGYSGGGLFGRASSAQPTGTNGGSFGPAPFGQATGHSGSGVFGHTSSAQAPFSGAFGGYGPFQGTPVGQGSANGAGVFGGTSSAPRLPPKNVVDPAASTGGRLFANSASGAEAGTQKIVTFNAPHSELSLEEWRLADAGKKLAEIIKDSRTSFEEKEKKKDDLFAHLIAQGLVKSVQAHD